MHRTAKEIVVHPKDLPIAVKIEDPRNKFSKVYAMVRSKNGGLCLNAPNTQKNNQPHN